MNAKGRAGGALRGRRRRREGLSALVSKIKASGADLVYWGGVHTAGGLIVRQMRDQGVNAVLMGGDGITSDEFATIGGPGVEGTLMTYGPDPRKRVEAKPVVDKFRAKNFEPEAYTLYSYAAVQIVKAAARRRNRSIPKKVAEVMRSGRKFSTVIGDISYDKKGRRHPPRLRDVCLEEGRQREDHVRRDGAVARAFGRSSPIIIVVAAKARAHGVRVKWMTWNLLTRTPSPLRGEGAVCCQTACPNSRSHSTQAPSFSRRVLRPSLLSRPLTPCEGKRSADRRWCERRTRGPPRGRADPWIARDHRPMTPAGAPLGAPPRHFWRSLLRRSSERASGNRHGRRPVQRAPRRAVLVPPGTMPERPKQEQLCSGCKKMRTRNRGTALDTGASFRMIRWHGNAKWCAGIRDRALP